MNLKKIVTLTLFSILLHEPSMNSSCMRIGHRGACGYEPENTIRSFQKALELSVVMIELDVYCCKSGEVVVIHDSKLNRTTDGTGYVEDKTLHQLKQLDAGKGLQIPTLSEVFDCVDRKVIINIELKGIDTAQPVAELIHRYVADHHWSYTDFLVSSFNHQLLIEFKKLAPHVKTSALLNGMPARFAAFAHDCGAQAIGLSKDCITQEYVDDAHARGLEVFVFTVNEPDDIEAIKKLGVDGIFSNYPDRV